MKFKHRSGRKEGKIDINGTKYDIVDGVFEVKDLADESVTLLKRNGHKPIVESKPAEIDPDDLTKIKGIGPAYAAEIVDIYEFEHKLMQADPADIADKVDGVSISKAKEIIDAYKAL